MKITGIPIYPGVVLGNAFVFSDIRRNNNGTPFWLLDDYWEGVGDPVPAWNFDRDHTTTSMDLETRPNHS